MTPPPASFLVWLKGLMARLRDWLSIQSLAMKLAALVVVLMIPASGYYAWSTLARQEKMALEVKAMTAGPGAEAPWAYNSALPVVFGSGSVLGFPRCPSGHAHHHHLPARFSGPFPSALY
jgi:hypothetical protein